MKQKPVVHNVLIVRAKEEIKKNKNKDLVNPVIIFTILKLNKGLLYLKRHSLWNKQEKELALQILLNKYQAQLSIKLNIIS